MLEIELKETAIKDKLFSELSIITLSLELEYFGCRIHNNCYMNYYVSLEKKPNSILHATARHTWERLTSNNTLIRKTITVVQLMNALDDYKARVIREKKKIENKRIEKMKYDKKIGEMYDDMFKKKENTCPQCEAVWKIIPNFCRNCGYCAKPKRPNDPVKNYIAGLPSRGVDKYRTYRDHILALDNRLAEFYEKAENQEKHIDDLMNTIKLKDDRIYEIEQDIIYAKIPSKIETEKNAIILALETELGDLKAIFKQEREQYIYQTRCNVQLKAENVELNKYKEYRW